MARTVLVEPEKLDYLRPTKVRLRWGHPRETAVSQSTGQPRRYELTVIGRNGALIKARTLYVSAETAREHVARERKANPGARVRVR